VVVVGAVGLGLKRSPFYEKELDFLISCSYGPGRYDDHYEQEGVDYPYAYVRWTENRNMAEYLRLVGEGKVQLGAILEKEYPLDQATQAYQELQTAEVKPLAVLLRYPLDEGNRQAEKLRTKVVLKQRAAPGKIRVALVGAGGFARSVHLPNLQKLNNLYQLRAVVSTTGSNAKATATQFGADYATSSYADVLSDPDVDAVLIATRHHLHAQQTLAAIEAGKAVFLEKPLALTAAELDELVAALAQHETPLMVGFNRRFSPAAQRLHSALAGRQSPLMLLYRVNAGYLPPDHWTLGPEGGGRIIGEACHMLDLCQFLVGGAAPVEVTATAIQPHMEQISGADNMSITVRYEDGSVATVLYTALGAPTFSKEYIEVFGDQKVFVIDDFKSLRAHGVTGAEWSAAMADKGHVAELEAFARYVRGETAAPIPLAELVATTAITLQVAAAPADAPQEQMD
jgi:predicted dehydrogenase